MQQTFTTSTSSNKEYVAECEGEGGIEKTDETEGAIQITDENDIEEDCDIEELSILKDYEFQSEIHNLLGGMECPTASATGNRTLPGK